MVRFALVLLLAFAAPQDPEKTYVLNFHVRMFEGRTFDIEFDDTHSTSVTYGKGFDNEGESRTTSGRSKIEGTCEVLSWRRPTDHETRWIFRTCERVENGQPERSELPGKRIRLLIQPKAMREYSSENGARLGSAEEAELDDIIEDVFKSPKKKWESEQSTAESRLSAEVPRKIGESWKSPVAGFFDGLFQEAGGVNIDDSKSDLTFTLASVKERDGSQMAVVQGQARFFVTKLGPAVIENGLIMDMTMTLEGCLDGKSGYREYTVVVKGKGAAKIRMPGKLPAEMEIDSQLKQRRIRRDRP